MLSPCIWQVIHALLTRPPLSYILFHRSFQKYNSVRLACVKHAASVHPEPGSNSHVCLSSQIPLASQFCSIRIYCFKGFVFFSNPKRSSDLELTFYFLNLSRFFTVQLSMSFCCAVLIYQRQLVYISISRLPCQELF